MIEIKNGILENLLRGLITEHRDGLQRGDIVYGRPTDNRDMIALCDVLLSTLGQPQAGLTPAAYELFSFIVYDEIRNIRQGCLSYGDPLTNAAVVSDLTEIARQLVDRQVPA